jgi:hypothetical protein
MHATLCLAKTTDNNNGMMYLQSTLTLMRLLTDGGTELVAMHR